MKRLLAMLLVLAMLAPWLPGTAAAEEVPIFTETVEGETGEVDTQALLEEGAMLFSLDSPRVPTLAEGEHIRWIDRLENPPEYAKALYAWLGENSDGDGTEDALIDPTQGTATESGYAYTLASFPVQVEVPLADYPTTNDAKRACSKLVSEQVNQIKTEAIAYLSAIMAAFDRDYPEVFWRNTTSRYNRSGYSTTYTYDGTLCKASTTFDVQLILLQNNSDNPYDIRTEAYREPDAIYTAIARRDANAAAILSGVPKNGTVYDQLLYLNDWLTHHNCYNSSENLSLIDKECRECISALEGRTGAVGPVCEAYARAFKLLCDRLGIPCVLVNGANHMWNYVQVDGAWYAADVTWNDPTVKGVTDAVSGYEHSKYLLCGASTVVNKKVFIESHPEWNRLSENGLEFVNGPKLSENAYDPSAAKPQCTHQNTEVLAAVSPTCTESGLTEGKRCTACGKVLTAQEAIPAAGHREVVEEAVAPTCTEPGLTEGKRCSVCEAVLAEQTEIPALGHDLAGYVCLRCYGLDPQLPNPERIIQRGICGENLTWTLDNSGTLTISGTGAMYDYSSENKAPYWDYRDSIQALVIQNGVTTLGNRAFGNCYQITEVTIPNSVTSIGASAFLRCTGLKNVTIPNSVTSMGDYAFQHCESLTKIVVPDSITFLNQYVFSYCTSLTEITIPDSVTTIGVDAFWNCTALPAITLPASITAIENKAFSTCTSLTSITFTGSAPSIQADAFYNITATAYYPADDATWTEDVMQNYGGAITWASYGGHTHAYADTVVKPTCTEPGYTLHTCACGDSYKDSETPATGHSWDEGKVTKEPTEEAEGEKTFTCTACGTAKTETLPKLNHTHAYTDTVVAPTCTEPGYTLHTCACGDSYRDSETPATGHSWDEGKVTRDPTEEAEGEKTFTCTVCGETKTEILPKLNHEHKYTDTVTAPTCTEGGYTTHTCACGDSYKDSETPATGHSWDEGKVTRDPTEEAEGEKTFTCTVCGETKTEAIPKVNHTHTYTAVVTQPTCTQAGFTTFRCTCGRSYTDNYTSALGHTYAEGKCTVCGEADPNWQDPDQKKDLTRLAGTHRFNTAFLAANQMKQTLGIEKFDAVVVASGMDFADALSGSYLAAVKNAPILLACQVEKYNNEVKAYIQENLKAGGTVYILGGENAIPDSFKTGLEGFTVERLAGKHRFDTNLKVLDAAGVGDKPILVATGLDFADCLSASAAKLPILLVYGDKLTADQAAFLEANKGRELYIIGGTGAVTESMEAQVGQYGAVERLAGKDRFETSVLIAKKFFTNPKTAVLAYAGDFPDGLCGGSLAAALNAPLILTMEKYEAQAAAYIQSQGIRNGFVLGGEKLLPQASVDAIFG